MKRTNHQYLCIGPGGRDCVCCFPAPGSKERKLAFRSAKRKDKQEALQEQFNDMDET